MRSHKGIVRFLKHGRLQIAGQRVNKFQPRRLVLYDGLYTCDTVDTHGFTGFARIIKHL
jgi:hypothetical protein